MSVSGKSHLNSSHGKVRRKWSEGASEKVVGFVVVSGQSDPLTSQNPPMKKWPSLLAFCDVFLGVKAGLF